MAHTSSPWWDGPTSRPVSHLFDAGRDRPFPERGEFEEPYAPGAPAEPEPEAPRREAGCEGEGAPERRDGDGDDLLDFDESIASW